MKVLMIFVDMLRAVNQNVCNESAPRNRLDDALSKVGGIVYSRCYSSSPDTPRGLASIWTGTLPRVNGCDKRTKYPRYFLNENLDTIWKLFKRKHLSLNLFVSKDSLEIGVLPEEILSDANIYDDSNLNRFLDSVQIKDNSVTFLELHDYHAIVDDTEYKLSGLDFIYETVGGEIDLIFDKFGRDNFDIVIIFSDHGCLQEGDEHIMSHRGRIQTYLQLWIKNAEIDELNRDDRLCSCMDIFPTMAFLLNDFVLNRIDGLNLLTNAQHSFLVIEDYMDVKVSLSQTPEWWGIIFPDFNVQTDCWGNWYSDGKRIQLNSEQEETFSTILKNYVGSYEENVKGHRTIAKYAEMSERLHNQPAFYDNGEKRIPAPNSFA